MSERERLRERLRRFLALLDDEDRHSLMIVGGSAPALYDLAPIVSVRPTVDIDIVIEAVTFVEWRRFVDRLEALRFRHQPDEDEPICRFRRDDLVIDVMPTSERALGFGSRWYAEAVEHRVAVTVGVNVHVISPLYFLATKLDAWPAAERSGGDPILSHDVEDIVAVLRGVDGLLDEIRAGVQEVHDEVRMGLRELFADDGGYEIVAAHLEGDAATQATAPGLLHRIREAIGAASG